MTLVKWNGDEIAARTLARCVIAVNETTKAAADEAEKDHWWQNETDRLERNTISEHAVVLGKSAVSGKFGSTRRGGFYGLFLEIQDPWLRPVADRVFPTVIERLRALP